MSIRTLFADHHLESYVQPAIAAPPLSIKEIWNDFRFPYGSTGVETAVATKENFAVTAAEKTRAGKNDHLLIRGNDQLDAINKHLDAVPLNRVQEGDLVVLSGRPGRREQWGIVTEGRNGELSVHHTDSHYWSKTSLTELARGSRLQEAYRPKNVR